MDNLLPQSAGKITTVNIPAGRDPFINTPLISVGKDRDSIERFWISSWNSNIGTIGLLVDEFGRERIYRFAPSHHGFYSAVVEDENTLWLCGDLSCVVRLDLAFHVARFREMKTILLTGQSGGKLLPLADVAIRVPSNFVTCIQEYHLPIYHALCATLEQEFFL